MESTCMRNCPHHHVKGTKQSGADALALKPVSSSLLCCVLTHTQYVYMHCMLQLRSIFWLRCLHAQQLEEYCSLHINQHIPNKPEMSTTSDRSAMTSVARHVLLVLFWQNLTPYPRKWTLCSFLHCLAKVFWLLYITVDKHLFSFKCSTVVDKNLWKWHAEAWGFLHTLDQRLLTKTCFTHCGKCRKKSHRLQ